MCEREVANGRCADQRDGIWDLMTSKVSICFMKNVNGASAMLPKYLGSISEAPFIFREH